MDRVPFKVCYVLTGTPDDPYTDMTLLSVWSLKATNPTALPVLMGDTRTIDSLRTYRNDFLKEFDEIIAVETPAGDGVFRNRFVKTTMRFHLKGHFIYLDSDTLIRGDLTPISSIDVDFAAARNNNGTGSPIEMVDKELVVFAKLGWRFPTTYYANGGVLFLADSPKCHKFSQIWHDKWLASVSVTGKSFDQPALNSALYESDVPFAWLDNRYNAQVFARPDTANDAVIWHIFGALHATCPKTLFVSGRECLRRNDARVAFLSSLRDASRPWLDEGQMRRWRRQLQAEYLHVVIYMMLLASKRLEALRFLLTHLRVLPRVRPARMALSICWCTIFTGRPPSWFTAKGHYVRFIYFFSPLV